MPKYVDGFVLPVSKRKVAAYRNMAAQAAKVWRDHGALDYKECVGDKLNDTFALPFPKVIRAKAGETIVFAWILYKSRAHRDRVTAKVMQDPRIAAMCNPKDLPFDSKRMLHGGFEVLASM